VATFDRRYVHKLKANYEKCVIDAIAAMDNNIDMRLRFSMDGKIYYCPYYSRRR
jgi:hypothetical protein